MAIACPNGAIAQGGLRFAIVQSEVICRGEIFHPLRDTGGFSYDLCKKEKTFLCARSQVLPGNADCEALPRLPLKLTDLICDRKE